MEPATPHARPGIERRVIFFLATLLLANPVIVFLLTYRIGLSAVVTVVSVAIIQFAVSRPRLRLLAAHLFNALALLSIFAHAEVILVHGFPEYVVENLYTIEDGYYFNRPLLKQRFTAKEYDVEYRTNVQGFRISAEQDETAMIHTADWLVLGDSFTQGAQVDFSELYTTALNKRFPDKIILNAGISGLGLGHEYNYFVKSGYQHKPDLVILQLCSFNDFTNVEPTLVSFSDRLITYSAFLRFLLADIKFTNPAALPLGRWTEPFHPDERSNTDFNIFYNATSPTKERDLASFERYLRQLNHAVKERGAQLLVVLIPTKEQVHARYLDEVVSAFHLSPSRLNMQRPNQFLGRLTTELGIAFIDLLPAFRESAKDVFFEYDEHLTTAGHDAMANRIAEYVEIATAPSRISLLSTDLSSSRYPMLSQDGTLLSYQSLRGGNMELFVTKPDMTEPRRLTVNDVDEAHPMLSRDSTQIMFTQGDADTHQTDVVVMNLDGSERTELTAGSNLFGAIATFSRTNLQVAYAEWSYHEATRSYSLPQIVVLDVVSGAKRVLTKADRESWRPVFSPDGTRVAYIAKEGGSFDLYLYDLTTAAERRLTTTPFDEWDPQFTPDGTKLVYAARTDDNWDLFVLELASGRTTRLTKTKGDEWDPSVSPDGGSVLFAGHFGFLQALFQMPLP